MYLYSLSIGRCTNDLRNNSGNRRHKVSLAQYMIVWRAEHLIRKDKNMTNTKNYVTEAIDDARDMASNFLDQIVDNLVDTGRTSNDLYNDYTDGDSYHHENHVDKWYNLQDAAELLDQLKDYEETDKGLWQGLKPVNAISAQAAYTYGNAVMFYWQQIVDCINEDATNGVLADALQDVEESETSREIVEKIVEQIIEDFN